MAVWSPARFPVTLDPTFPYEVQRSHDHNCAPRPGAWMPHLYDSYNETRDAGEALHHAIDIMAPIGAAVVAMDDGVVLETWRHEGETLPGVGFSPKGGWFVWVKYDSGFTSYGAHLAYKPVVRPGQRVRAGQRIGAVGSTGNASTTCAHLHLGVENPHGEKINPYPALKVLYDEHQWLLPPNKQFSPFALVLSTLGLSALGLVTWDEMRRR